MRRVAPPGRAVPRLAGRRAEERLSDAERLPVPGSKRRGGLPPRDWVSRAGRAPVLEERSGAGAGAGEGVGSGFIIG